MASVKIDPEGGSPVYSGPDVKANDKQAGGEIVQIPVSLPDSGTLSPGNPVTVGHGGSK